MIDARYLVEGADGQRGKFCAVATRVVTWSDAFGKTTGRNHDLWGRGPSDSFVTGNVRTFFIITDEMVKLTNSPPFQIPYSDQFYLMPLCSPSFHKATMRPGIKQYKTGKHVELAFATQLLPRYPFKLMDIYLVHKSLYSFFHKCCPPRSPESRHGFYRQVYYQWLVRAAISTPCRL